MSFLIPYSNRIYKVEYFNLSDFECRCGCGLNNISNTLLFMLDSARKLSGVPFVVNRGCSCVSHNQSIKNFSSTSSHLLGLACDIAVKNDSQRFLILRALLAVGFNRIGIYKNHIHVDIDFSKTSNVSWYV